MIMVYFLKPKIEAGNKAVHVTMLRKKKKKLFKNEQR